MPAKVWPVRIQVTIGFALSAAILALGQPARPDAHEAATWKSAENLAELVIVLEDWLDKNSMFAGRKSIPPIRMIEADDALEIAPQAARTGSRVRGLYDPELDTIYLVRPWSKGDVHDVSTLLHELSHRRQAGSTDWTCAGQEELSAYRAQQTWLEGQGATGRIDWFAVHLAANCLRSDMHP